MGLATVAPGVKRTELVARLIPAYVDLLQQLKVRCCCSGLRGVHSTQRSPK